MNIIESSLEEDEFDAADFGLDAGQAADDLSDIPTDLFIAPEEAELDPNCSPSPSVHSSSAADSTDASSELVSPSPSPVLELPKADKAAHRVAMKNRARLHRYHQSKAELVQLRDHAAQLQKLLERLKRQSREEERDVETLLSSSPSPLAEDEASEIDPSERSLPKMRRGHGSGTSASSWKDVAMTELTRRRRAEAVQRKLTRVLGVYGKRCELFQLDWANAQIGVAGSTPRRLPLYRSPQVPGADSIAALTHNGAVVLRELYHIACSASGVQPMPSASSTPDFSGGALAYSLFLGPGVEFERENTMVLPGIEPSQLLSAYLRALSTQPPDQTIVRASHKTHKMERSLFERDVSLRIQSGGSFLNLHGVKLTQIYDADDHIVLVMSGGVNTTGKATAPLFRNSEWMVVTKSTDAEGNPCCLVRSRTRVHCATPSMTTRVDDGTPRSVFIKSWLDKMDGKHKALRTRLQLVLG